MNNLVKKFDVIILSLAIDDDTFNTTKKCVDSYISTADELINKIYVVETNPSFNLDYNQPKVQVIKPNKQFNYNEFYNIALERCKAEFVIGPNNDLVIQPDCLQIILKEFNDNPGVQSISPIDRNWHRHTKMFLPSENKLYYGTEVSLHMYGCIFCCRRSVFEQIGYLDETFYFFYQDNDYIMSLERCGLLHGVHTGARVTHQSGHSNRIAEERLRYTPKNMNEQGELLFAKWSSEPFKSGGYKKFKEYLL
jgi:GT2 family glycosyltransferase